MSDSNDPVASKNQSDTALEPVSPCLRLCCLDDEDVCVGCFRHLEEIRAWSKAGVEQKRIIVANAKQRELAHRQKSD